LETMVAAAPKHFVFRKGDLMTKKSSVFFATFLAVVVHGPAGASPAQPHSKVHHSTSTCQVHTGSNNSFVGVPGFGNVAGGAPQSNPNTFSQYAGVVAGTGNQACSSYTGILAGENNVVGDGDFIDDTTTYSVIGGGQSNLIHGADSSFIGAGGSNSIASQGMYFSSNSAIVTGATNSIVASGGAMIGGGSSNRIVDNSNLVGASSAFIGSGDGNTISGASESVIVGGQTNSLSGAGSAIVGGQGNVAQARQDFIGGGYSNQITISSGSGSNGGALAVIGGGSYNTIASTALNAGYFAVIGGGTKNSASGLEATIAGGYSNSATGQGASVPGGSNNIAAGTDSFAAGTNSYAESAGSFVFSDDASGAKQLVASGANVFLVRASGGAAFYSNPGLTAGVVLRAGSGAWSNLSDRNAKTDLIALDPQSVLAKVAALPVDEWSYRTEGNVRHVGPMAQDFYAAFKVGEDDRHITTVDEDGVALAAIKALYADKVSLSNAMKRKDREVAMLQNAVNRLAARDARLEADVEALGAKAR
jgi:hypothetical protein